MILIVSCYGRDRYLLQYRYSNPGDDEEGKIHEEKETNQSDLLKYLQIILEEKNGYKCKLKSIQGGIPPRVKKV